VDVECCNDFHRRVSVTLLNDSIASSESPERLLRCLKFIEESTQRIIGLCFLCFVLPRDLICN
jgi:hypothetical protein